MSTMHRTTRDEEIRKRAGVEVLKKAAVSSSSLKPQPQSLAVPPNKSNSRSSLELLPTPLGSLNSQLEGHAGSNNPSAGTVGALSPLPPVVIARSARITDAAQLMACSKCDALLVIDGKNDALFGILTDKDIVYRVLAKGKSPGDVKVEDVATRDVKFARITDSAQDALSIMLKGGFRHLPVMSSGDEDETSDIVGVLDIARCLGAVLGRIEKMTRYTTSQAAAITAAIQDNMKYSLDEADRESSYQGSQNGTEVGGTSNSSAMRMIFDQLLEQMKNTILTPAVETTMVPVSRDTLVSPLKTTVAEAIAIMVKNKTTAILAVSEGTGTQFRKLAGIMTTKDIVLRVVAARFDARVMSVSRAMTPKPTSVISTTTIGDALKIISKAKFLHLPVVSDASTSTVVGLIDVIKLTQDVLTYIDNNSSGISMAPLLTSNPSYSSSSSSSSSSSILPSANEWPSSYSAASECGELGAAPSTRQRATTPLGPWENMENEGDVYGSECGERRDVAKAVTKFMFKVLLVSMGTYLQILARDNDLESLKATIQQRIRNPSERVLKLSYIDGEGDSCTLETDNDLLTAVQLARESGFRRVILHVATFVHEEKPMESNSATLNGKNADRRLAERGVSDAAPYPSHAIFASAIAVGVLSVGLAASASVFLMRHYFAK